MNPEIKAEWVADLRSGKFKQGRSTLRRNNQDGTHDFCCLGVLAEQAVRKGVATRYGVSGRHTEYVGSDGQVFVTGLSDEVNAWAGLPSENPPIGRSSLMQMNDDDGASFDDIADAIERYL
jgi:hypothetical protein